ncbi:MAG: hypothetical protein ACRDRE_22715, partial [Pseudonocardiaceae bacterium]
MGGKALLGAVGGLALLPLAFITLAGGAGVASAQAPSGGCAVRVSGPATGPAAAAGKQKGATLTAARMAVARTIVGVAKGMGVTERGAAIALGTAMQESGLDPEATDGYGTGVFQQQG